MTNDIETNVGKNANATVEASRLLKNIVTTVETGSMKMAEMKESMDEIQRSSEEIEKIVKMIDDIAFQTNILALNAMVEASRAGDAGLGFGVVADEIRILATQSNEASINAYNLIQETQKSVETGIRIGEETSEYLAQVVTQTATIDSEVTKIAENQYAFTMPTTDVVVDVTYHHHISGRSASKTFLVVFDGGPKGNDPGGGMVLSTANKWRTISGYSQAVSYIKSALVFLLLRLYFHRYRIK